MKSILLNKEYESRYILNAMEEMVDNKKEYLNLDTIPFPGEVDKLINDLNNHNISKLTISDTSTGLMEFLLSLNKIGFEISGMVEKDNKIKMFLNRKNTF